MERKRFFFASGLLLLFFIFIPSLSGSPTLLDNTPMDRERLLSAALKENRDYLLTQSQSREASALLSIAKAARLPTIRYSSDLSYLSNPPSLTINTDVFGLPPMLLPSKDISIALSEKTRYDFGLSLEQPVFTWGRISNSIKAAELGTQAAALQLEQKRREMTSALDIYLYSLSYINEMASLLAEQNLAAERLIHISEESYAGGFLLRTDLLEARLLTSEVGLNDYSLRESRNQNFQALKTLTGLADLEEGQVRLPLRDEAASFAQRYGRADKDRLLSQALAENLGLKLLGLQTGATEKLLAAAKGQYYGKPELGLMLQLNYTGPAFPFFEKGWRDDDSGNFTATLGIRGLLFDGGAVSHTIRQKQEELTRARLEEEKGRRSLEEYIETALYQLEVSQYRQTYLEVKTQTALAQKEQAENAWQAGSGEEREYLIKELEWYGHRIALLQEELNGVILTIQLENLAGF